MQVRILGPLEVWSDEGSALPLGGQKQRIVLALLALRLGEAVPADELIEAAWGEELPVNPANALQYQVAQLRKILEPDVSNPRHLLTVKPGYRLDPETVTTDARQYEDSLAAARDAIGSGDIDRSAALVESALATWRGPALVEFRYDEFAQLDADRLESERLSATELEMEIALASGRHAEITSQLAKLTAEHSLREGLWATRVIALYRSGRQTDALRVAQDARDALGAVGLEPGVELRALEQRIIEQDESLLAAPPETTVTPHNLPAAPNRLIGRDGDVQAVGELLETGRLVTLLGPGGAGKTRLGLAVGHAVLGQYVDGVWFAPLESLQDGALLAAEIGRFTGMREKPDHAVLDTLTDHLGGKRVLLILDNCEHLIEPVATVAGKLLERCPLLSILATSQLVLEIVGEAIFVVTPLAIPGRTASIYDPITDIDGVALFLDRAREAGARVDDWEDGAIAAVANIVTALDGMPLAVELAAARTRSMSLGEIAQGLDDRFSVLTRGARTAPERQRSLRGAVEWSLNLLDEQQRALMACLSVLAGTFDAHAAAALTGQPVHEVREDLAALVDRSLLTRAADVSGAARFSMLESLRQYGLNELGDDQRSLARDAHLAHFAEFAQTADSGLRGAYQIDWLYRIDASHDNIRAALAWSLDDGSLEDGMRLASWAGRYWDWRGLHKEGSAWTTRLLEQAAGEPVRGQAEVRAMKSFIAWEFGDLAEARISSDLAIADAAVLADPFEMLVAHSSRILLSRSIGDLESARSEGAEAAAAAERAGDPWAAAWAESALATVALAAHDLIAAESHAHRCRELFVELGDRRGESWGLISLAQISLDRGDVDAAERDARAALDAAVATEDDRNTLWTLEILADASYRRGESHRSARLWGAARPLRESRGLAESVSKLSTPTDLSTVLYDELGELFDALVTEGRNDPLAVIRDELAPLDPSGKQAFQAAARSIHADRVR